MLLTHPSLISFSSFSSCSSLYIQFVLWYWLTMIDSIGNDKQRKSLWCCLCPLIACVTLHHSVTWKNCNWLPAFCASVERRPQTRQPPASDVMLLLPVSLAPISPEWAHTWWVPIYKFSNVNLDLTCSWILCCDSLFLKCWVIYLTQVIECSDEGLSFSLWFLHSLMESHSSCVSCYSLVWSNFPADL